VDADPQLPALSGALRWLRHARRILVFTGAGMSTESGIPDYRGPQGVWRTRDPSLYTIQRYLADAGVRRERWRDRLASPIDSARPNAAHLGVTALQASGRAPVVVTQNIDGLHQAAGTENVIELHGTTREAMCMECRRRIPVASVLERVREGDDDPHCELCRGLLKTATISFGQAMPDAEVRAAMAEAERCDACLAIGSTLSVWPAAGVPVTAVRSGARLVIVNEGATELDGMADALVSGRAGTVVPALVEALLSGDGDDPGRSARVPG
jgi:NAD-dependent deacetylase